MVVIKKPIVFNNHIKVILVGYLDWNQLFKGGGGMAGRFGFINSNVAFKKLPITHLNKDLNNFYNFV